MEIVPMISSPASLYDTAEKDEPSLEAAADEHISQSRSYSSKKDAIQSCWGLPAACGRLCSSLSESIDKKCGSVPFMSKAIPSKPLRLVAKLLLYMGPAVAIAYLIWLWGYNWAAFLESICQTQNGRYSFQCTQGKDKYQSSGERVHRIAFYGDSFCQKTDADHQFLNSIINDMKATYPSLSFDGLQSGIGGDTISRMKKRIFTDLINYHPEAVILWWDTDLSDTPTSDLLIASTLASYRTNLMYVVATLKANDVVYIGVGGPNLLGELPAGQNEKDTALDAYEQINRDVATLYNVTFIATRDSLQAADAAYGIGGWGLESGYLTQDGEHLTLEGVAVTNPLFLSVLKGWYG